MQCTHSTRASVLESGANRSATSFEQPANDQHASNAKPFAVGYGMCVRALCHAVSSRRKRESLCTSAARTRSIFIVITNEIRSSTVCIRRAVRMRCVCVRHAVTIVHVHTARLLRSQDQNKANTRHQRLQFKPVAAMSCERMHSIPSRT